MALVGLAIVIGAIVVLSRPEREPEDRGVPLSRLVEQLRLGTFGLETLSPIAPINRIGTNGVPYLLKWIRYEQPAWKKSLFAGINSVLGKVRTGWGIADHRKLRADGSSAALCILSPRASEFIPELKRIEKDPKTPPETRARAARTLKLIYDHLSL